MKPAAREMLTWVVIALVVFALSVLILASCAATEQAPALPQALSESSAPAGLVAPGSEPAPPAPRCSDPEHDSSLDMDWAALELDAQPEAGHGAGGHAVASAPPPALPLGPAAALCIGLGTLALSAAALWRYGAKRSIGSRPW